MPQKQTDQGREVLVQVTSSGSALRSDRDHLRDGCTMKLSIIPLPNFPLHSPLGCGEAQWKQLLQLRIIGELSKKGRCWGPTPGSPLLKVWVGPKESTYKVLIPGNSDASGPWSTLRNLGLGIL